LNDDVAVLKLMYVQGKSHAECFFFLFE